MGGRPIFALALVGMPVSKLSPETIGKILSGGAAVCAEAGVPIAGGHSIDSVEPIYGLVALGLVHPDKVQKNSTARAGDVLILTKALGVGVLSAAFKQERLDADGYAALIASTTKLNTLGADLPDTPGVHAVTDVTGFGLLGHALEMCRGAGLGAELDANAPALLPGVEALARAGVKTGASGRNWASYGASVRMNEAVEDWRRDLLTDPQTSGGLLIAVDPAEAESVLGLAHDRGFEASRIVGRLIEGTPEISVKA
jgi:selenide,water dikinase